MASALDVTVNGLGLLDYGLVGGTVDGLGLNTYGFVWPCGAIWDTCEENITTTWETCRTSSSVEDCIE